MFEFLLIMPCYLNKFNSHYLVITSQRSEDVERAWQTEYLKTLQTLVFKGSQLKRKSPHGNLEQETHRKVVL